MAAREVPKSSCSDGTKMPKESVIDRLATPSVKHSATSAQGTKRLTILPKPDPRALRKPLHGPADLHSPHVRATVRAAEGNLDDTLIIGRGFNGPRLSGNGGYVAGILPPRFYPPGGAAQNTLPPPTPPPPPPP